MAIGKGSKKVISKVESIKKRAGITRRKIETTPAYMAKKPNSSVKAATIPRNISDSVSYLGGSPVGSIGAEESSLFDLYWQLYRDDGIVGSVVDSYVDISVTKGSIENCTDENLRAVLEFWIANLNNIMDENSRLKNKGDDAFVNTEAGMLPLASDIFQHYLVTGHSVLFENWSDKIVVPSLGKPFTLPVMIHLYDISSVIIDSALAKFGIPQVSLKIDTEISTIVRNPGDNREEYNMLLRFLGKDVITQINRGATEINLPAILTTLFKRRGRSKLYGSSFLRRCLDAVAAKRRIQALDQATIAGMLQRLTILCLGHDDPASRLHVPTRERTQALFNMVDNIKTDNLIIWPGTDIKVIDTGANDKVMPMNDQLEAANNNIMLSLGATRLLIDGVAVSGGGKEWVVVAKTVNMLEHMRSMLKNRIDKWFRLIALKNNFKDEFPTWRWSVMNLRDDRIVNALIQKAFELGLMGYRDSLNALGFDGDEIIKNRIKEVEDGLTEILVPPSVPYSTLPNGRPPGSDDSSKVDRGRAMEIVASASMVSDVDLLPAAALFDSMRNVIANSTIASQSFVQGVISQYISAFCGYASGVFSSYGNGEVGHMAKWENLFMGWVLYEALAFKRRVLNKIATIPDGDDFALSVAVYLDTLASSSRVFARAIHYKASLAMKLGVIEATGYVTTRITNRGEIDPCGKCKTVSSLREYELSEVFNLLPLHNGCRCTVVPASKAFGG